MAQLDQKLQSTVRCTLTLCLQAKVIMRDSFAYCIFALFLTTGTPGGAVPGGAVPGAGTGAGAGTGTAGGTGTGVAGNGTIIGSGAGGTAGPSGELRLQN